MSPEVPRAVIVTVTPNAAIDRTLEVGRLEPGTRVEARAEHAQAGGKGVNVARVLHALGVPVCAVVVVAGERGRFIVRDLERAGIAVRPVAADGESRTCLELVEAGGRVTQVHGRGADAGPATVEKLRAACGEALAGAAWLAVCGSLAPGLPDDTAARLVRDARGRGVRSAVDARGAMLQLALAAGPDLVRVNREEWAGALGSDPERAPEAGAAAAGVISAGAGPVLAWQRDGAWQRARPPRVALRNPVGCGDAMLAGLLARLAAGDAFGEALRFAIALGAAEAESPCAGRPDPARARALLPAVRLEPGP